MGRFIRFGVLGLHNSSKHWKGDFCEDNTQCWKKCCKFLSWDAWADFTLNPADYLEMLTVLIRNRATKNKLRKVIWAPSHFRWSCKVRWRSKTGSFGLYFRESLSLWVPIPNNASSVSSLRILLIEISLAFLVAYQFIQNWVRMFADRIASHQHNGEGQDAAIRKPSNSNYAAGWGCRRW